VALRRAVGPPGVGHAPETRGDRATAALNFGTPRWRSRLEVVPVALPPKIRAYSRRIDASRFVRTRWASTRNHNMRKINSNLYHL